jgi:hypothetical protein
MKLGIHHVADASFIEWHLYKIGITTLLGATDFTSATAAQIYTLDSIEIGDIVHSVQCRVDVASALTHAAATWKIKVGITGSDARFIADTDLLALATVGDTVIPSVAAAALPYFNGTSAAVALLATVTAASSTIAATSTGEIWIWVPFQRRADRLTRKLRG